MKVNDIPYEPLFEARHLAAAKKFLETNKENFRGTANFAIVTDNGRAHPYIGMSCHRSISTPPVGHERVLVATEHGTTRSQRKNEVSDGFLDWFVNSSYFGRFIVEKDLDFCRSFGFIISADVAAPLLQNICIVTRHFYEVATPCYKKFDDLVASGLDPMIAYPLCFNTNMSHTWSKEDQIVKSVSGHRAHPLFDLHSWKNWMAGNLGKATHLKFNDKMEHYRTCSLYTGGTKFFFDKLDLLAYNYDEGDNHFLYELVRTSKEFRDGLSEYRGDNDVSVYRPPNPFTPRDPYAPKPRPQDLTLRELWDFALPWCLEHGIFTPNPPEGASNGKEA